MKLDEVLQGLMQEGKGILLAGETTEGENERLAAFGAGSEDARRTYREILFTTPGIEEHLSGIILSPESVHGAASDGTLFLTLIASRKIFAGILFDEKTDDAKLSETLREYASHGASFAAFTLAASVSDEPMTDELQKNIGALAARAKISHAGNVMPLLLLDVSMYGAHTAAHAEDSILEALSLLSDSLKAGRVDIKNVIIGVSMAVSGSDNPARAPASEVAERSVRALTTAIPETGGVVFLSDAQYPEEATANLNALARLEPLPWPIAFCFSKTLQDPVLTAWKGSPENFADAQAVFKDRLSLLSQADAAGYSKTLEEE
ncbi:MAG: class I fructose-bisphosphate aldolase [bacterium]|nr:class I fructose-bisphosphate aldolase [bacterium]